MSRRMREGSGVRAGDVKARQAADMAWCQCEYSGENVRKGVLFCLCNGSELVQG